MESLKRSPLAMVAFLVLSKAPPSVALLGFWSIKEKGTKNVL